MRSAISSTLVSMGVSPLQGERMAEDAGAGQPPGQDADEVDGVDVDALAAEALAELVAGRALEHQLEGLAMDRGPLADDIGDESPVVIGGGVHVAAGRLADVDAVGPHVAGEAHVEQVLERSPADRRAE